MTLHQFIALKNHQKVEAAWNGTYVATRHEDEYMVVLYKLELFYIELYYNKKCSTIDQIKPFTGLKKLQAYLDPILN